MSDGIPASSLLPPAFGDKAKPTNYWSQSDVPEDGKERLYITSEIHSGWKYFTTGKEVRLSKDYPTGFETEIGYKYGHGPGKTDPATGTAKEERDKPRMVWLLRAWHVERKKMVAATIDSFTLQSQIHKILENEEYRQLPNGLCNFYLTIHRDSRPASPAATYMATGTLRVCQSKDAIKAAAEPWWPESYWKGLHPLEDPAAPPPAGSMPATLRDEHGADTDVVVKNNNQDDEDW